MLIRGLGWGGVLAPLINSTHPNHGTQISCQHISRSRMETLTSATINRLSTHFPNSLPAVIPSTVSARSTTLLPYVSNPFWFQLPRISAYPRCASFSVVCIAAAAGWDGCVVGVGSVRRKATRDWRVAKREGGNWGGVYSSPAMGEEPEEPSATCFVYN